MGVISGLPGIELPLASGAARVQEFKLEPFDILDYVSKDQGPLRYRLRMGQPVVLENPKPSTKVQAYPRLKSEQPMYGQVSFGGHPFLAGSENVFHFVMDESRGTGTGYDRFIFDQNGDQDLTNDPVIAKDTDPPDGLVMDGFPGTMIAFEAFDLVLHVGDPVQVRKQRVIPQYQGLQTQHVVSFLALEGRKGKIKIGSEAYDCKLVQDAISGGFDNPWIACYLDEKSQGMDMLGCWPYIDGTFHILTADREGTKLTVRPYAGPLGNLNIKASTGVSGEIAVDMGWIMNEDRVFDLMKCPKQGKIVQVPVGDYRPIRLSVEHGKRRITLGMLPPDPLVESPTPPVSIRVRETEGVAFRFPQLNHVQFKWANGRPQFKPGDEIKIEATMGKVETGLILVGLEDMTKKEQSYTLPDGTDYQRYASVDPRIVITNSKGKRVAQGKMPFG